MTDRSEPTPAARPNDFLDAALNRAGDPLPGSGRSRPVLQPRPRAMFEPAMPLDGRPGLVDPNSTDLETIDDEPNTGDTAPRIGERYRNEARKRSDGGRENNVAGDRNDLADAGTSPVDQPDSGQRSRLSHRSSSPVEVDRNGAGLRLPASPDRLNSTPQNQIDSGGVSSTAHDIDTADGGIGDGTGLAGRGGGYRDPVPLDRQDRDRGRSNRDRNKRSDASAAGAAGGGDRHRPRDGQIDRTPTFPEHQTNDSGWSSVETPSASGSDQAPAPSPSGPAGRAADTNQMAEPPSGQSEAVSPQSAMPRGITGPDRRSALGPRRIDNESRPIHVTIGRIEVRAPAPAPSPKPAVNKRPRPRYRPPISLEEFLGS